MLVHGDFLGRGLSDHALMRGGEGLDDIGRAARDDLKLGIGGESLLDAGKNDARSNVPAEYVDGDTDLVCHVKVSLVVLWLTEPWAVASPSRVESPSYKNPPDRPRDLT